MLAFRFMISAPLNFLFLVIQFIVKPPNVPVYKFSQLKIKEST